MNQLTRRDFLRLCGTSSIGLALAACGVAPTPMPASTSTPSPTSSTTPNRAPSPTLTITPTSTPPPFATGEWSSWKESDGNVYHDASKAYQFVGSKNDEHAHLLDLTFGTLNVGVMVPEDLIALPLTLQRDGDNINVLREPQKIARLKQAVGAQLTGNKELVERILNTQGALGKMFLTETEKGFGDFFIIIEGTAIAQVIQRKRNQRGEEELARFKVSDSGNRVSYQDFEPYSKSPLEFHDGTFWKDGKVFIPRGAVLNHFTYQQSTDIPERNLTNIKRDINNLSRLGGNFAILHINLGEDFIRNPKYREILILACEYAKNKGMSLEITARGYGRYKGPNPILRTWEADYSKIDTLDMDALSQGWKNLLADDFYAQRLGASVDIFAPTPEPARNIDNTRTLRWDEIKNLFKNIHGLFRQRIGNSNVICAYAPPFFATNIDPVLADPIFAKNDILEWHPYYRSMTAIGRNFDADFKTLIAKQILFFIGEMGATNNPLSYTLNQFELFNRNGIGYAYYALNSESDDDNLLVAKGKGTTLRGYLATIFFRAKK